VDRGFSPSLARSLSYAGLVGSSAMPNLILFDYFTDTEDALKHGAELLSREFNDLKPSLIFPLDVPQPSVSTSHPAAVARAYSEDMLGAVGLCMHVIVLNTENAFTPFELQLTMPAGRSLPAAGLNATLPFEGSLGSRLVPMSGSGKLQDTLAPNSVNVYRLGCSVPCTGSTGGIGFGPGCSALQKKNLSPNPDFEMAQLLGSVYGWAGGKAGWYGYDGHDLRARMFLDTGRPKHGRYSLRLTVPTSEPLLQPWVHYVPVASDLGNLSDAVRWVRANGGAARRMADAGAKLVDEALSARAMERYMRALLRGYAELHGGVVEPPTPAPAGWATARFDCAIERGASTDAGVERRADVMDCAFADPGSAEGGARAASFAKLVERLGTPQVG